MSDSHIADVSVYQNSMKLSYHPTTENKFPPKHNLNKKNGSSSIIRMSLLIFYWKTKNFQSQASLIFVNNDKILSSHTKQLNGHMNSF